MLPRHIAGEVFFQPLDAFCVGVDCEVLCVPCPVMVNKCDLMELGRVSRQLEGEGRRPRVGGDEVAVGYRVAGVCAGFADPVRIDFAYDIAATNGEVAGGNGDISREG